MNPQQPWQLANGANSCKTFVFVRWEFDKMLSFFESIFFGTRRQHEKIIYIRIRH